MRRGFLVLVGVLLVNIIFAQSNQAKSICSGATVTLTPFEVFGSTGAQFRWTSSVTTGAVTGNTDVTSPVSSLSQTLNVSGTTVGIVVYSITPTTGSPFTLTVTVNPTAIVVDGTVVANAICSGANFYANVSGQVPAGTTFTWTAPTVIGAVTGGSGQVTQQPFIAQTLSYTGAAGSSGTATYTVIPYVGGCANPIFTFPVTVRLASGSIPIITNTGSVTQICSGTIRNFTPTIAPAASTTSWARPAVAGTTAQTTTTGTTAIVETITSTSITPVSAYYFYTLQYAANACQTTQVVTSVINPVANIADKTVTVCSNSSFTVNINELVPANTTFSWTAAPIAAPAGTVTPLSTQPGQTSNIGPITLALIANRTALSTVTYLVTARTTTNAQACNAPNTFPVQVTVNPVPIIANQTAPATCSGTPFNFSITTVPSGTTYTWPSLPTISVAGALTGGAIQLVGSTAINQTLTNITTSAATATYIVTPLAGSCQGANFNAVVQVNPIARITNANQVKTICSGSPVTNPITGVPTGTLYSWTVQSITPSNSINNSTSLTGQGSFSQTNLVNTTNAPAVISYLVQPVTGSCLGTPYNLDVTVNPTPNFSTQATTSCSGTAFKIDPANAPIGTTYTWTQPNLGTGITGGNEQTVGQNFISEPLINASALPSTATYTITATANGCIGTAFTGIVTVNPLPIIANYSNNSCSGSPFSSTPNSSISGTTYTWPLPVSTTPGVITGGNIQTIPQTVIGDVLTNTSLIPSNYVYTITPSAAGCNGIPFTLTQSVKPTPNVAPIKTEICSNTTFSVSPSNVPFGTTYTWANPSIAPAGSITGGSANGAPLSLIGETLTNPTSSNAVALYTVTPITNGCTGSTFSVEVTVKIAANLSTQTATICSGQSFDVKPTGVPLGTTYTWIDPARGPNVSGGSAVITGVSTISQILEFNSIIAGTGTATYSVTPNSNGCLGNNFNLNVTIKPLPLVSDINSSVCSGNSFTITPTSNLTNTLFTWATPIILPAASLTGAIERTSAVQNISQTITNTTNAPATASYRVTPFSNGCTGNPFTFVQTVNPTPTIATQTTKICSNTSFNVAPTNVPIGAATLYTWSAPVINPTGSIAGASLVNTPVTIISQSLTNPTNAVATATYDVTPVSGTCTGSTFKVLVTVTPRAVITAQTTNVCSGSAFNVLPTAAPANTLYTWAEPTITNGILGATIQNTPQTSIGQVLTNSNLGILTGTANYVVTPLTDGCIGNTFTIAVAINSSNSVLNSTLTPAAVCSGNTFSYLPTSANTGTAFAWTRTAVAGITNAELSSFGNVGEILTNSTDAEITVAYTFTLSTNGCTNLNKQIVNVLVKPAPKLSSSITPPAICSAATFSYAATSNTFNTVFNWSRLYVVGVNEAITSGVGNINESLSNPTFSAVIVPYNFTLVANGCTNIQTVFVTVNPVLTVPDQNSSTCSNTFYNFKAPNTPDNTVYTWAFPTQAPGISGGSPQLLVPQNTFTQLLNNNTNAIGTATYIVTPIIPATFTAGCIGRPFSLTISVSPQPILTSNLSPSAVCSGTEFNYVPTSNIPSSAFNWTREAVVGISNVKSSGFNTIKEILLDTTTSPINIRYRYTLSAFGCTDTTSVVNVLINASPIIKTQVYTICSGSAFIVSNDLMPARTTYTWGSPVIVPTAGITGFRNITKPLTVVSDTLINNSTALATANYIIQPVGSICSIAPFNAIVSVKPALSLLPQETSTCSGAAFSFTPANIPTGTTFTWQLPAIAPFGVVQGFTADMSNQTTFNQKLTNLSIEYASATYNITPTSNGCIGNIFKLKVNVNPIPTSRISGPSGICVNGVDSFLVNFSGTGPWSLSWNDSKNGLPTSITNINTSPYTIYQPSLPNASTYTFKLLRVKDAFCTNDTSTVSLTQNLYALPSDTILAVNGTQLCVGKNLPLAISAVRAGYQWFRNDTLLVGAQNALYDALLPGLYSGTTLNSFGCSGKTSNSISLVSVKPPPDLLSQETSACSGAAFTFTPANIPTGTKFSWQIPTIAPFGVVTGFTEDTTKQSSIKQKLINLSINYASATYIVTPSINGCAGNNFNLKVNVNPIPTTKISGPTGICINEVDSILVNFSGTGPWSLSWNDSKNGLPTSINDIKTSPYTIYQPSLPNASTYTFNLFRVKDAYCSNDTSTASLTQDLYTLPTDTIVATNGTQLCVGKTLPLTINAARAGYKWFRNDTLVVGAKNALYDALLPGLYTGSTTNSFGCVGKTFNSIRMVQVFNNPIVNFSYDSSCMNVITNYKNISDTSSAGAVTWNWIFGGKDSAQGFNAKYAFKTPGTQNIKLIVTSAYCGYSIFKDSNILIRRPDANKILPPVFTYKNTATPLMARTFTGASYTHKWIPSFGLDNPNIINPIFNFNTNQTYAVKIISEYGCTTTDSMRVHVFEQGLIDIFVPKSFSPNRDGINDQLFVYLAGIQDFRFFRIYNKYGQLVFETKNAETPWEGKVNGTDQPLGAYVWIAEGVDINGKMVTKNGSLMLLR